MALTSKVAMGLGQTLLTAICPSVEQAAGVVDCSDPCQAQSAACIAQTNLANQVLNLPASTAVLPSGYQTALTPISQGGNLITIPNLAPITTDLIPGMSNTILMVGAAGLLVLILFGGRRR